MAKQTDELFDIIDCSGNRTGAIKPRAHVHRDGDWHATVHVWLITPRREILLQKRASTKETWPGKWDISAAGHIQAGDSAIDTAIREVREELGLGVRAEELHHLRRLKQQTLYESIRDNEINDVFAAITDIHPEMIDIDHSEVESVQLVTLSAFEAKVLRNDSMLVPHPDEYPVIIDYCRSLRGS